MKINVTEKRVSVTQTHTICAGEYGVNECEFLLPDSFKDLSVVAVFNNIPVVVTNGRCFVPSLPEGNCALGVYAYSQTDGVAEIMYSPKPAVFYVEKGSYSADHSQAVVPEVFSYEIYCKMLQDYWRDVINQNTLAEYNESATEKQYYSAKVLNDMYESLMGDIAEAAALVGGGA